MDFGDVLEGMEFEGDTFAPASIVCDTRDGELAIVVSQTGDDLEVRFFTNPLEVHRGKATDFTSVEGGQLACVGFVVDSLAVDEAHTAKAVTQISKLLDVLPDDLVELIRPAKS